MFDQSTSELEISPKTQDREYQILGQPISIRKTEKEWVPWSTEWLLSEYTKATDKLIGLLDGTISYNGTVYEHTEGNNFNVQKKDLPPPKAVVYLDKSARPVEWMVRELWPLLARQPGTSYAEGVVPPRPDSHYLNIDRIDWLKMMNVPPELLQDAPNEYVDFSKIDKEHIERIRALYSTAQITEQNLSEVWNHPTIFDGKHIMVVDEVKTSGRTLEIAQKLLSMAVPEATFSGHHWTKPKQVILNGGIPDKKTGRQQFTTAWVPIWYKEEKYSEGRGVSERDPEWPEKVEELGQEVSNVAKIGRYVLSTPTHNPATLEREIDAKANALREDFKQLAKDLGQHKVLYRPDPNRDPDDFRERVEAINQMSFDEWRKKRDQLEPKY